MKKNTVIRDLNTDERPYEKALAYGVKSLRDEELLAVILRSGVRGMSCIDLAGQLLLKEKGEDGLLGLMNLSISELTEINGIGKVKAVQIQSIIELSKRIASARRRERLTFNNPETIAAYYMEELRHERKERLIMIMLDTKNHFLGDVVLSIGTVNASLISVREMFIEALKHHAVYIILLHNHPSGDATPSNEDIEVTKRIFEAGELIGISLIDHIIIGDNCFESLLRCGRARE